MQAPPTSSTSPVVEFAAFREIPNHDASDAIADVGDGAVHVVPVEAD